MEVIGSEVLFAELDDISDKDKRNKIKLLVTKAASNIIELDEKVKNIAIELENTCKMHGVDSLHLGSAISAGVDFFITTDDEILRKRKCIKHKFKIDVINPINFVRTLYG